MPQINTVTNQYTFELKPVEKPDWRIVSNEEWNVLIAGGWMPAEYIADYRVSKDTITSRVIEAGKLPDLIALIAGLPADQQFLWTNFAWFWNTNTTVAGMCAQLGLDPAVILAKDPYI
jgi:hypothetical protein